MHEVQLSNIAYDMLKILWLFPEGFFNKWTGKEDEVDECSDEEDSDDECDN